MKPPTPVLCALIATTWVVSQAHAQTRLRINHTVDLTITLLGGTAWFVSEALKPKLAPTTCNWCIPPSLDSSARDILRWNNTSAAHALSNVTGFALAPFAALGLDALTVHASGGTAREWSGDAIVVLESIVIAANVNQIFKFVVGRERPFVHVLVEDEKGKTTQPSDNNLSFFSGHTTLAFSAAASCGMIASIKGHKSAPAIWATGLLLASTTGYLRIAADKHYLTDVFVGAAWGTVVGVIVPWLHRPLHGQTDTDMTYSTDSARRATRGFVAPQIRPLSMHVNASAYGFRVTGLSGVPVQDGGAWLGFQGIVY